MTSFLLEYVSNGTPPTQTTVPELVQGRAAGTYSRIEMDNNNIGTNELPYIASSKTCIWIQQTPVATHST